MTDIAELGIRVRTSDLRRGQQDMSRFARQGQQTERTVTSANERMSRSYSNMARNARAAYGVIGTVAGAAVVQGLQRATMEAIRFGNEIDKSSQTAGISAERLQELRFAFTQLTDVTDKGVDLALQRFNRRLGLAQEGATEYQAVLNSLGVTMDQQTGPALERALRSLADIDSFSRRAALASRAFGEEAGPQLAAGLEPGIDEMERLVEVLHSDVGLFSDENTAQAAKLSDELGKISQQFTTERAKAILEHADAVERMADAWGSAWSNGLELAGVLVQIGTLLEDSPLAGVVSPFAQAGAFGDSAYAEAINRTGARSRGEDPDRPGGANNPLRIGGSAGQRPPVSIPDRLSGASPDVIDFAGLTEEARQFFDRTRTGTEQIEAEIKRVEELMAEGWFRTAGINGQEVLDRLNQDLEELGSTGQQMGEEIARAMEITAGGAIEEMFARGEISASNFGEAVLREIARIVSRLLIVQPLMQGLFGASAGGEGEGLIGQFLPQRAMGGAVSSGQSYIVGERGPEVFTPAGNGHVSPNQGGGQPSQIQVIDQRGAQAPPVDVQRQMRDGQEQIKILVRGEVDQMFADGSIDRRFAQANMPVRRRGAR